MSDSGLTWGTSPSRSARSSTLEAAVCECYKVVKDEYDRLLG